jgi:sugar lactone lactonase YvrE
MPNPPAPHIQRLGALTTALGECPVWHGGLLWLLDCRAGTLFALNPDTGAVVAQHNLPPPLGSFAFNHDGRAVVALKEAVVALDLATGRWEPLAQLGCTHPDLRLNDGVSMPDGGFVVGTMHVFREPGEAPLGGLYRLGPQGQWDLLDTGLGVTNGPCVNPLNGRLYVADSEARHIHSYTITPGGTLTDKRLFVQTNVLQSGPDGCCFDTEGGLWTALVRVGALVRFGSGGQVTHRIELPVTHPSALCFGGPTLEDLFVTTIRDSGRLRASGPLDGAVLKVTGLGHQGLARPLCRIGQNPNPTAAPVNTDKETP